MVWVKFSIPENFVIMVTCLLVNFMEIRGEKRSLNKIIIVFKIFLLEK